MGLPRCLCPHTTPPLLTNKPDDETSAYDPFMWVAQTDTPLK